LESEEIAESGCSSEQTHHGEPEEQPEKLYQEETHHMSTNTEPNFKKHPIGTEESQPRGVIVIVMFSIMFAMLLCSIVPFVWQAWSMKP
jgi:hypothetical protein